MDTIKPLSHLRIYQRNLLRLLRELGREHIFCEGSVRTGIFKGQITVGLGSGRRLALREAVQSLVLLSV